MPALEVFFRDHPLLAIAFSGGLDSRFLCACAQACGCDVVAVHVHGPHVPGSDTDGARAFARDMQLKLLELPLNPLTLPEVARTDPRRCYFCKKFMLSGIRKLLVRCGEGERTLCDGSNHDDLSRYRPGLQALKEAGIFSPLALAELGKKDIRARSVEMGFPLPREQARPCLLTRYDYNLPVHQEELLRIDRAEQALLSLTDVRGRPLFADLRLRITPQPLLQVQTFRREWEPEVRRILGSLGFDNCTICQTEHISGFFDTGKTSPPEVGNGKPASVSS